MSQHSDLPPTGKEKGRCPGCGIPGGGRYRHERRWFCWTCWSALNPPPPAPVVEPPHPIDLTKLIDYLTEILGPPMATPEEIWDGEKLVASNFRVFCWECPRCLAGGEYTEDPWMALFPYRPFVVTSTAEVYCSACWGSVEQLTKAVKWRAGAT